MAYGLTMIDVMAALKARRAKAEGRLSRAIKALESAKKDLQDVIAAERIMADITGESVENRVTVGLPSGRDTEIAKLLATNSEDAKSPAELHPIYVETTGDSLNLEAFRTALWRLQKKIVKGSEKNWAVKSDNGRYWREAVEDDLDDFDSLLEGEQ